MKFEKIFWIKLLVFLASLAPLCALVWRAFDGRLGANPVETITHHTGDWSLRFLLLTLAMTPLRLLTGQTVFIRLRRMLGLFTFFYVVLHFSTWLVFDHFFDWTAIQKDILKRPYITVGFAAFVLLVPLAVTSTDRMMKRLGRRWKALHQMVYPIAVLSIFHYLWLVKADVRTPIVYALVLVALLGVRIWHQRRARVNTSRVVANTA